MIVNVRGCNGSGKTTAVRALLGINVKIIRDVAPCPITLDESKEIALIGPYEEGKCGGCDRIKTFALTQETIRCATERYRHVVFEGVIVSTVFGSWATFCREVPFVWAFLDTPLEVCLKRIYGRNGGIEIKTELVESKWRTMQRIEEKAKQAGFLTERIPHERAGERLEEIIGLDARARRIANEERERRAESLDVGRNPRQISFL